MSIEPLRKLSPYEPCHHMEQCSDCCRQRHEALHFVQGLFSDAIGHVRALERQGFAPQLDLFVTTFDPLELAEWRGIHEACAVEVRRRDRAFWVECPQESLDG